MTDKLTPEEISAHLAWDTPDWLCDLITEKKIPLAAIKAAFVDGYRACHRLASTDPLAGEPVAWMIRRNDGLLTGVVTTAGKRMTEDASARGWTETPLYAKIEEPKG